MPAAGGILKKEKAASKVGPPPPPPPIIIRSGGGGGAGANATGLPPPKPRRFLSRAADESQGLTRVLLVKNASADGDDDEPKTEESYDYRDIDFASEIYSFRPFPPRPKPPRKRSPPPIIGVMESDDVDEPRVHVSAAEDGPWRTDTDADADVTVVAVAVGNDLSTCKFMDDVLDVAPDHASSTVHFGDAEILEGMTDDEDEDEDDNRTTSGDYSEMEFAHVANGNVNVNGTALTTNVFRLDYGGYEPVGNKPCPPYWMLLRHQQSKADMNEYVPPVASTVVGDPFSWRRRGRRRYCDYGYNRTPEYWSTSALDKILDGCQRIEERIVARDLTPPGTLLRTSGVENKRRRRAAKTDDEFDCGDGGVGSASGTTTTMPSPPPRRPPPLPPKIRRTPSPFLNDGETESLVTKPTTDDRDDVTSDEQQKPEQRSESEAILQDGLQVDMKTATDDVVDGHDDVDVALVTDEVEGHVNMISVERPEGPTKPLLQGQSDLCQVAPVTDQVEFKEAFNTESDGDVLANGRASRRDAFERDRRPPPPRPPPPAFLKPVRPLRRKRFRSADPLMASEFIVGRALAPCPLSSPPPPPSNGLTGNVPKRSASFHTAEDIRRRIDIQAQNFLRVPRRRDCLSSSSTSLKYECLRRAHSPTPLYSLVNKGHRKTMISSGSQTNLVDAEVEAAGHSPTPPVPPALPEDDGDGGGDEVVKSEDLQARLQEFEDWAAAKRLETSTTEEVPDETDPNANSSPSSRPLPTPPVPTRHRGTCTTENVMDSNDMKSGSPSGISVVFCQEGGVVMGKMAVVPELKVLRLTVGHLEASTFRVSQVEADVLKVHVLSGNSSGPSLPPSTGPSGGSFGDGVATNEKATDNRGIGRTNFDDKGNFNKTSKSDDGNCGNAGTYDKDGIDGNKRDDVHNGKYGSDDVKVTGSLNGSQVDDRKYRNNASYGNGKSATQTEDEDTDGCPTVVDKEAGLPANDHELVHQIERPESIKHRDSLDTVSLTTVSPDGDGFYFNDTLNRDDPWTTLTSGCGDGTTSGSASYVTCDETLHDDLDDDDFDFNLELEGGGGCDGDGDDDEDAATGCATPTELEMDVTFGSDVDGDGDACMKTPILDAVGSPTDENCNVGTATATAEIIAPMTQDPCSSSSSSSSGIEGIVKMRHMKLKGRLADSTNSWYDDGDVPGQMADNDVSDHGRDPAVAINSIRDSGSPVRPGQSEHADEDSDDVDGGGGGSLIKQRIAELFESHSGGGSTTTTGSGGSSRYVRRAQDRQPRRHHSDSRRKGPPPRRPHSKFYLALEDASPVNREVVSMDTPNGGHYHIEAKLSTEKDDTLPRLMHDAVNGGGGDVCDIVVESARSSSDEDEDGSVASSSSPRILSAYSDSAFVAFDNEEVVADGVGKNRTKAFHIARELMTSEKVFVDVLNLLTKDFLAAIDNAAVTMRQPIVPEDVLGQILDCLPQLKSFNEELLRDLEERIDKWDEIGRVSDVIVCKGPFLKLYTMYIKKFPLLINNLDEACKKYPHFAQVVRDFEMSDRCRKLELKHYMLKPVQRIPQYRMLLQDYLMNIEPDSPDFESTKAAVSIVSAVASHANDSMKEGDKFAKLLEIQSRIAGNHEVIKPGRTFIKEGELFKLCRKEMQLRSFILFSDVLLHLSVTSQGLLRIHHELPLSNVKVSVPTQEDFQNEFSVISVARSFTLAASSPVERDEWISELNSAIQNTVIRHETFLQAKLHQLHLPEQRNRNEVLGQQAPVWIPDSRVTMCQLCVHEFTLTFRRHHCRACGKVVCSVCSANRAPLFYRNYETARVCDECFVVLKKQIEDRVSCNSEVYADSVESVGSPIGDPRSPLPSFDNLKAQFKKYYRGGSTVDQKHKRLLPRVLKEVCANDTGSSMSGYLYKRFKRTWRRGWFVIKDKVLYTYRASQDVAALDSTPLLGFEVVTFMEPRDGIHQQLIFELRHPGYPSVEFYAESLKSADRWLEAVRSATVLE